MPHSEPEIGDVDQRQPPVQREALELRGSGHVPVGDMISQQTPTVGSPAARHSATVASV